MVDIVLELIRVLGSTVLITLIVSVSIILFGVLLLVASVKDFPTRLQQTIDAIMSIRSPRLSQKSSRGQRKRR